jgi:hypothetical protein
MDGAEMEALIEADLYVDAPHPVWCDILDAVLLTLGCLGTLLLCAGALAGMLWFALQLVGWIARLD